MPNVFEITDPENGKTYRMEADDGVTQEEALSEFEALGRDQWSAFEYTPQESEPSVDFSVPAPVSVPTVDEDGFYDVTNDKPAYQGLPEAETQTVARGALIQEDVTNPLMDDANASASILSQMISRGDSDETIREYAASLPYSITGLETNLRLRREGKQTGAVQIDDSFERQLFAPDDPGLQEGDRGGLDRLSDAYQDATQYGFPGWIARKGNDWLDSSKDKIKEAFPGRSEEWYEQMHDYAISRTQQKLRTEGAIRQQQDPNWRPDDTWLQNTLAIERWAPWFVGTMAGSAGPEMAIAPGASLGARATAQGVLGAGSDLGYQLTDISAGVEDEISYESLALNALMGAGGETAITGIARTVGLDSARGKGVNSTEVKNARFPRVLDELDETIPPRTTQDQRTKAYRVETAAAMESITDRVNVLTQDWSNAPEFEIMPSFKSMKDLDNNGLGVYRSDGKVLLNTEQILDYAQRRGVSADDVVRSVVFHEGLGHHGLSSKYGDELDSMMGRFYDQGDADFRSRVDNYMDVTGEEDFVLATEEVLAIMSEKGELPVRIMDRLVTFFREWARKVPGLENRLKYTDNEIRTLMGLAQRETTEGAPSVGGGSGDKYMVTYHGSGADFDRFDHSYMSSGEGAQVFGWGTYLTESRGIAESYRDKLSNLEVSWGGVQGQDAYTTRIVFLQDVEKKADGLSKQKEIVSAANDYFNSRVYDRMQAREFTAGDLYDDNSSHWKYGKWSESDRELFIKEAQPILDYIDEKLKIDIKGKLYEVEVPDNAKFLEWEEPIHTQRDLELALEQSGYEVTDYPTWNLIQRDAYEARLAYTTANERLNSLDNMIREAEETGGYITAGNERIAVEEGEVAIWEKEADDLFEQVQSLSIKRNRAVERAEMYFHEDMNGGDVYTQLATLKGSDKAASEFLAANGFGGNRFLANNYRKGAPRKGDGTDTFNYVVFDDQTPQIVNKYMKPLDLNDNITAVTPDELSPEELFDSMNALDLLEKVTKDYKPTVFNLEDLEQDAAARGIAPSALLKQVRDDPGSLARKLFQYDIAAQKMNDRVTNLYSKIQSGNYTMRDKDNYIKTVLGFEDLTARIFDQQSDVGRALRAIQEMEFTRKRVTTLRDTLRGLDNTGGIEALDDPATFEKFARQLDETLREAEATSGKMKNPVIQTLNVPRAIMSSMDLSAPLRQGLFFITKLQYWSSFFKMHQAFFSQRKYDDLMTDITSRPTYEAMVNGKLAFSRIDEGAPLSAREEDFQTDLAAQIPIIGRGVKASNRAYSAFRNKLSADMFDYYYNMMNKAGVDTADVNNLRGMASFINAATGRGNLPNWAQSAAPQLNSLFFSPRLIMSRFNLLNPVFYYKLPPVVRREAITQGLAMGSLAYFTMSIFDNLVPEASVEMDPRSTDFGKVKVNNTRYDVLGGFSQFIRLYARLATGQRISSSGRKSDYKAAPFIEEIHGGMKSMVEYHTGEPQVADPTNPAYAQTMKDSISQFLENKMSPNASYVNDLLKGENFIGEPFDPVDGALTRVMPMYFQDMAELISDDGPNEWATGIGVVASLYGVGTNTYVTSSLDPKQELKAPETFKDKDLADGENEYVIAKDGVITLKPEAREMWGNRLNLYFSQIMEYEMSQEGWADLEPKSQADIIQKAKDEARREAKKDMVISLGVE